MFRYFYCLGQSATSEAVFNVGILRISDIYSTKTSIRWILNKYRIWDITETSKRTDFLARKTNQTHSLGYSKLEYCMVRLDKARWTNWLPE